MPTRHQRTVAALQAKAMEALRLQRQGDLTRAAALYREVLRELPGNGDVLHALGVVEAQRGRPGEAAELLARAARANPNDATVQVNYGNALLELKRIPEAVAAYDRALAINRRNILAHYNRGVALADLQRPQEALDSYEQVLSLDPGHAEARYGKANALVSLNRPRESLAEFQAAQALDPNRADFYLNEALARLVIGDFAPAWQLYEWRWKTERVAGFARTLAQPAWRGDADLAGKTILLHAEQGFGDTLHFCRYATLVAERAARVVLEVQPALVRVLSTLAGVHKVLARGDALPPFDLHCPILSLPLAFGTTLATIPSRVPYLRSDPELIDGWRARLGTKTRLRVGLVWSGSGGLEFDQRSIALAELATLFDADVEVFGLQKEVRESDRASLAAHPEIRQLGDQLGDFADTAALLELMDLIVTVDTAAAHLAGAMAKPVWLLLAFEPTWRWLLGRDDSPWYPTARLFRQRSIGDWTTPVAEVRAALRALARS
ncbi:MAG: tetratricopeptide repeat protein [Alphaproteobacteria bacterium]|nr:tetratricopeptide repeat protein [Alphaproteobacteria bacterium]